jgi:hypothetical protein
VSQSEPVNGLAADELFGVSPGLVKPGVAVWQNVIVLQHRINVKIEARIALTLQYRSTLPARTLSHDERICSDEQGPVIARRLEP